LYSAFLVGELGPRALVLIDAQGSDHPVVLRQPPAFGGVDGLFQRPSSPDGIFCGCCKADDRSRMHAHRLRDALSRGETCRVLLRNYRQRRQPVLERNDGRPPPASPRRGGITHFGGPPSRCRRGVLPNRSQDCRRTLERPAHQPTFPSPVRDDRFDGGFIPWPYLEEFA